MCCASCNASKYRDSWYIVTGGGGHSRHRGTAAGVSRTAAVANGVGLVTKGCMESGEDEIVMKEGGSNSNGATSAGSIWGSATSSSKATVSSSSSAARLLVRGDQESANTPYHFPCFPRC